MTVCLKLHCNVGFAVTIDRKYSASAIHTYISSEKAVHDSEMK